MNANASKNNARKGVKKVEVKKMRAKLKKKKEIEDKFGNENNRQKKVQSVVLGHWAGLAVWQGGSSQRRKRSGRRVC